MSYVFGNSVAYDYDLYTTGGQKASVSCSQLIQTTNTNYVIIVDISNTVAGTYSYSVSGEEMGTITSSMCPFLISDISGLTSLETVITFTPSENRDGYGSIFYYTLSRYTSLAKNQIYQQTTSEIKDDQEVITTQEVVLNNPHGYELFQKMETPLYCYTSFTNPDRIFLLPDETTTDTTNYANTTGIPVLNNDGTLNLSWNSVIDELGYGPKDLTVYDNSNNYYPNPLIIQFSQDGQTYTSYSDENLIVDYSTDASGQVKVYDPLTPTIGAVIDEAEYMTNTNRMIQRDSETGALSSPVRIFYEQYRNLVYRTYQHKSSFVHSNRRPTVASGASLTIATYSVETIGDASGVTVGSILGNSTIGYNDENAAYDKRGIILGDPTVTNSLTGNWAYRFDGETAWTFMNFVDGNNNSVFWYLPEKKSVSGVDKDVYIKFITSANQNGDASLTLYGWDRTNNIGPVEGPVAAELISNSQATDARSVAAASIVQSMAKISYPPYYDNTIGNTYSSINQDTTQLIEFNNSFFNTIGFLDISGPGPARGVVVEDICGGAFGVWNWRFDSDPVNTWRSFVFTNGGLHIKESSNLLDNITVRFLPDKYKYGTATIKLRLWDTSLDVPNGTYASVPSVYNPNGSYSATAKTWNVVITNTPDGPKLYDISNIEITDTFSKEIITYGQGFTPADDGTDSITVSSILDNFLTNSTIGFAAGIVDVDNGFIPYDKSTLGIVIEDISGGVNFTFQRLVSAGNWRSYSPSDFIIGLNRRFLHLKSTDIFRFVVPETALGTNLVSFRFRLWNRSNETNSSIVSYDPVLITQTSSIYSIPVTATINYDNTNLAPVINTTQTTYSYSLGSQGEDSGDSVNFSIAELIDILRTTSVGGQPLVTDPDGAYVTQIPLFGLALIEAPAVSNFPNPGVWKYRAVANGEAQSLNFTNGFFHVTGDNGAQLLYTPNKHTYGPIQLVARIWDRSNETDVSAGQYYSYTGAFDRIAPYSAKTVTFQLNISNVNDRPTLASGRMFLTQVSAADTNPAGQTLYSIMQSSGFIVADPDPQDIGSHGMAIVGLSDSRLGTWQYMVDGSTWSNIPLVFSKALHLDPMNNSGSANTNVRMRFVPNPSLTRNRTGVRLFQFYIWDRTNRVANGSLETIQPQTDNSYSLISYTGRIIVNT